MGDENNLKEFSLEEQAKRILRATNKIVDYLARRDHSEKELRQKLSKFYSKTEIDMALEMAHENSWLRDPQDLSRSVTEQLNRKNKPHAYIQNYLRKKGLPSSEKDTTVEAEKALKLVKRKFARQLEEAGKSELKLKIQNFLMSRGFSRDIIFQIFKELLAD